MTPHTEYESLICDLEVLAGMTNYHGWILDEISPYLGSRLAEIGAGIGTVTAMLALTHLTAHPSARLEAFEPSGPFWERLHMALEQAHHDLIRTDRLRITKGYFHPLPQHYDTIIMINVLEHIQDDQEAVRTAYQSLSPGGTFIVYSPALAWLYSPQDKAVGHYRRYTLGPLQQLFGQEGFTVIRAKHMDCMGVLPWYLLNVVGGATTINPHLAHVYDRWVVPITRWLERLWPPRIGKNVLIVGRKPALTAP